MHKNNHSILEQRNREKENLNKLEYYLLSVREIEKEIGEKLDYVPEHLKDLKN